VTPRATVVVRGTTFTHIEPPPEGGRPPLNRQPAASSTLRQDDDPWLIDAHVHVEPWTPAVFLKYGVTTVRDLHSDAAPSSRWRRGHARAAADRHLGAAHRRHRQFLEERRAGGHRRRSARRGPRAVDAGARAIKVYTRLQPSLVAVIVAEARARGVPVAAHLGRTTAVQAAEAGVASIEHLSGVSDAASDDPGRLLKAHDDFLGGWTAFELEWQRVPFARLETVARQLIARGVVIVPTLALHEAFSRMADADLMKDPALADVPPAVLRDAWNPADIMGRARWTPDTLAQFKKSCPCYSGCRAVREARREDRGGNRYAAAVRRAGRQPAPRTRTLRRERPVASRVPPHGHPGRRRAVGYPGPRGHDRRRHGR